MKAWKKGLSLEFIGFLLLGLKSLANEGNSAAKETGEAYFEIFRNELNRLNEQTTAK